MRVEKREGGALFIRFGKRFAAPEVERISEAALAMAPLSTLTLNFGAVQQFDLTALVPLVRALEALRNVTVVFTGLTAHQAKMLRYFGIQHGREVEADRRDEG